MVNQLTKRMTVRTRNCVLIKGLPAFRGLAAIYIFSIKLSCQGSRSLRFVLIAFKINREPAETDVLIDTTFSPPDRSIPSPEPSAAPGLSAPGNARPPLYPFPNGFSAAVVERTGYYACDRSSSWCQHLSTSHFIRLDLPSPYYCPTGECLCSCVV